MGLKQKYDEYKIKKGLIAVKDYEVVSLSAPYDPSKINSYNDLGNVPHHVAKQALKKRLDVVFLTDLEKSKYHEIRTQAVIDAAEVLNIDVKKIREEFKSK